MGKPVALSVNLPANQPLMRAFVEKRLLQELQQLDLVTGEVAAASVGRIHCAGVHSALSQSCDPPNSCWLQVQQAANLNLQPAKPTTQP